MVSGLRYRSNYRTLRAQIVLSLLSSIQNKFPKLPFMFKFPFTARILGALSKYFTQSGASAQLRLIEHFTAVALCATVLMQIFIISFLYCTTNHYNFPSCLMKTKQKPNEMWRWQRMDVTNIWLPAISHHRFGRNQKHHENLDPGSAPSQRIRVGVQY